LRSFAAIPSVESRIAMQAGARPGSFSNDHLPPHFHAKRKGQWEVRVYFLESSTSEMFHVVWLKGKEIPRADSKLLEQMVIVPR
jgi:hypothetical protein